MDANDVINLNECSRRKLECPALHRKLNRSVKSWYINSIQIRNDEDRRTFGKVDILVNNAGVYGFAPLERVTFDEYKRQYETNVLGLLLAAKAALPHFPATEGGSVINISSLVSTLAPAAASVYASTKGAVDTITKTLTKELAHPQDSRQCYQSRSRYYRGRTVGRNSR